MDTVILILLFSILLMINYSLEAFNEEKKIKLFAFGAGVGVALMIFIFCMIYFITGNMIIVQNV